jgi:hypothetical protein
MKQKKTRLIVLSLMTLCAMLLNTGLADIFSLISPIPLYMDTIFTVAMTLSCGFVSGCLVGVVPDLIKLFSLLIQGSDKWPEHIFTVCQVLAAALTVLFVRLYPAELGGLRLFPPDLASPARKKMIRETTMSSILVVLLIFSLAMALMMSLTGGICNQILDVTVNPGFLSPGDNPEVLLKLGLLRNAVPLFWSEILCRIPVNIVDRFISIFAAYGFSRLFKFLFNIWEKPKPLEKA